MPKQKYALESDGPRRLEIAWDGGLFSVRRNIQIFLDGNLLETIQNPDALQAGWEKQIENVGHLHIRLTGQSVQGFKITYNDQDVGQIIHPQAAWKEACGFLYVSGWVNLYVWFTTIVLSLQWIGTSNSIIASFAKSMALMPDELAGWTAFFLGVIFFLLGFAAKQKHIAAFAAGIVLLFAQLIFYVSVDQFSAGYLLFFAMAAFAIFQGVKAWILTNQSHKTSVT